MPRVILVAWPDGHVVWSEERIEGGAPYRSNERRLDVLRQEPAEYLYYRVVWAELRGLASALIPSESRPVEGRVVMKEGIMAWQEAASR